MLCLYLAYFPEANKGYAQKVYDSLWDYVDRQQVKDVNNWVLWDQVLYTALYCISLNDNIVPRFVGGKERINLSGVIASIDEQDSTQKAKKDKRKKRDQKIDEKPKQEPHPASRVIS